MKTKNIASFLLASSLMGTLVSANLSGLFPTQFKKSDPLKLQVGRLNSIHTHLPFDFYFLRWCEPSSIQYEQDGVGDAITGDNIANTRYEFKMMENQECQVVCTKKYQDDQDMLNFKWLIEREYQYPFYLDDLPSAYAYISKQGNKPTVKYENGIPLGDHNKSTGQFFLYNHLDFIVSVHETYEDSEAFRIVGFKIEPSNVKQELSGGKVLNCQTNIRQPLEADRDIIFTYSVKFEKSELQWASRWDHYLQVGEDNVHWLSIINSFMIVLCLAGLIAHIMSKALKRDITVYELTRQKQQEKLKNFKKKQSRKPQYTEVNQNEQQSITDDKQEGSKSEDEFILDEIAWKKVKGEVFKRPKCSMLFSILVGTGIQILTMIFFLMIFALVGIVSPQHRGTLISTVYFFFIILSNVSGYFAARFYKMFQGSDWLLCTLMTSALFPTFVLIICLIINFANWFEQSSAAVPFPTIVLLLFVFCFLSVPNVWFGSFLGFKKGVIKNPGKINKLSREIPAQPWYLRMKILVPIGGILPFAAVFIEFLYIMTSIWRSYFYYMFGFLFLILIILIITSAEVAIVQTYFQLCAENYQWWWRSFFIGASSGFYLFLFSIYYFFTQTEITRFSSSVIYFSSMLLLSASFALMTGAIGFLASFYFNRKIYSMIKSD